jgi:hypothetical protein
MIMIRRGVHKPLPLLALLAAACNWDGVGTEPCSLPEVVSSSVAANPSNVLSAFVTARIRGADSGAIRYKIGGSTKEEITPLTSVEVLDDSVMLPVLGLRPNTEYSLAVVSRTRCASVDGPTLNFTTGTLPSDLPTYVASGPDPSPGYVVFAAGSYGLAIDNIGRVVWYYRFPAGAGLNFQPQPNGRYLSRPSLPGQPVSSVLFEIDPLGNVSRMLGCVGGMQARLHDFIAKPDGSYWVMCDEMRVLDLSADGGPSDAQVMGQRVQHVGADRTVLFEWSAFDHLQVDYRTLDTNDRVSGALNWTHGNAIDLDSLGNLLISFRNLSEILKIDAGTGAVAWRLGGRANQFTLPDGTAPKFARQHGVRFVGPTRVLLLNNLGDPSASRAERYEIDEAKHTVRMIASYGSGAGVVAQIGGTTQNLPGGRTLVSFGNGGRVEEYDSAGVNVWRIDGNPGYVFRAQRILSLYQPGVGTAR